MIFDVLVAWVGLAQERTPWWDGEWAYRRKLTIKNGVKEQEPVWLTLDPEFLELSKKCSPSYSDLRVVGGGQEIPRVLDLDTPRKLVMGFRVPRSNGPTGECYLYYGNPRATEPQPLDDKRGVLAEGPTLWKIDAGPGPFWLWARLSLLNHDGSELVLRLKPRAPDTEIAAELSSLASKLGDDTYRIREDATSAIIKHGRSARTPIENLRKHSPDPEVRWRCGLILDEIDKEEEANEIRWALSFPGSDVHEVRTRIGGKQDVARAQALHPFDLEIERSDGAVSIKSHGGRICATGRCASRLDELWFESQGKTAVRIDAYRLRPGAGSGQHAFEIGVEETR